MEMSGHLEIVTESASGSSALDEDRRRPSNISTITSRAPNGDRRRSSDLSTIMSRSPDGDIRRSSEFSTIMSRDPDGDRRRSSDFSTRMSRRKSIDSSAILDTNLRRCLTTLDITLLAVGQMIGMGVYVIIASVAKNIAGPAIIISFLFSGVASFLSALCYAELGVRYPKAGSAYSYTYLALGELWAFIVGWNMALEYVIGAAATARACSAYIDSLTDGYIKASTINITEPINKAFSIEYLDFFAVGLLLLVVVFLSFGVRITSYVNNIFSVISLAVIIVILGVGAYFSDISNWTGPTTEGFMPYGWYGVLGASASCFYAFVGFDCIASAGEETNAPQKAIPRATMISMAVATVSYVGVSIVLTLMVNYKDISGDSGLPDAFGVHGVYWAKYIVVTGAICGMATAIVSIIFAMTRLVYGMAEDGLLLTFCSKISPRTKTPLPAMYVFVSLSGILTLFLNINSLIEIMSIGALIAYLVVSISVIVLRYRPPMVLKPASRELDTITEDKRMSFTEETDPAGRLKEIFRVMYIFRFFPPRMAQKAIIAFVIFTFCLCGFTRGCLNWIFGGQVWALFVFVCLLLCVILSLLIIVMHHQSNTELRYKVPLFPLVPALSIILNAILIVNLQLITWVRLLVWMVVGLALYFTYGMEHSKLDQAMQTLRSWVPNQANLPGRSHFIKRGKPQPRPSQDCLFDNPMPETIIKE